MPSWLNVCSFCIFALNILVQRSNRHCTGVDVIQLDQIKEKRLRETEMEQTVHRLLIYLFYVCVLYVISYGQKDPASYHVTKHIEDVLITGYRTQLDGFTNVSSGPQIELIYRCVERKTENSTDLPHISVCLDHIHSEFQHLGNRQNATGPASYRRLQRAPAALERAEVHVSWRGLHQSGSLSTETAPGQTKYIKKYAVVSDMTIVLLIECCITILQQQ